MHSPGQGPSPVACPYVDKCMTSAISCGWIGMAEEIVSKEIAIVSKEIVIVAAAAAACVVVAFIDFAARIAFAMA